MDNYEDLIALGEAKRIAEANRNAGKPRSEKPKRSNKWFIAGAAGFFLVMLTVLNTGASDTEKMDKAEALKVEAMQSSCARWNDRHTTCYGRGKTENGCKQFKESTVWFTNQYGEIPEVACAASTVDYSFLELASK